MKNLKPGRMLSGALHLVTSKTLWLSLIAVVISATIFASSYINNVIYIVDGDNTSVTVTAERDPMEILAEEEIVTTENDLITFTSPDENNVGQVVIQRGFPVRVTVDSETHTVNWFGGTVADLLDKTSVTMGAHDKITHSLDKDLVPYDNVEITRVDFRSYDVSVKLPKNVVKKSTSLIKNGTSRVIAPGEDGLRVDTYDEILENGVVVETMLSGSSVTKEPVEELMLVGNGSAISNFDFSAQYPLDANGIPVNYKSVTHNRIATGYWRAGRPWGASGQYCEAGTVAVRAAEYPYGSKLYIRTASGNFIYGYAVPNDTGSGLMQGIIDVDLYYETFRESQLNGRRMVDIYVLE